ncbi:MAG: PQ-loop domain-containing transporter [Burkholderiaceae bacterium]|nr:PQ-loop domain-containing transporter [Burkholderiaceae bacterium]
MWTEAIGWMATAVLLATVGRQVYSQWRSGSTQGVSSWLFIGQMTASTLFFVYSLLLDNWVFVCALNGASPGLPSPPTRHSPRCS